LFLAVSGILRLAPSPQKFIDELSASGLMSSDEIKGLIGEFRAEATSRDPKQIANWLVQTKRLTAYQAEQLAAGLGKSLLLGNYVILAKLGQGGMGTVLKAQHRRMKRIVALKVLAPTVTKTPEIAARFQREVEAAARLNHPHIVAAFDADVANDTHFLVMEYVEGQDLSVLVKRQGTLDAARAVDCVLQAARGLDFAHRHGVIHRDIKPGNLLLDTAGKVRILDMGLARIEGDTAGQAELTHTGAVMGTVDYMAPEQALSTKHADARSDIYSLGITLWYLLVGRPAYEGDSLMARLLAHRDAPIPSLREHLKGVTGEPAVELDRIFQKFVAKRPADRFASMADVVASLERWQRGEANTFAIPISSGGMSRSIGDSPTDSQTRTSTISASAATRALPESSPYEATAVAADSKLETATILAPTNVESAGGLRSWLRSGKTRLVLASLAVLLPAAAFLTTRTSPDRSLATSASALPVSAVETAPAAGGQTLARPSGGPSTGESSIPRYALAFDGFGSQVTFEPFVWDANAFTVEAHVTSASGAPRGTLLSLGDANGDAFSLIDSQAGGDGSRRSGFVLRGDGPSSPHETAIGSDQREHRAVVYDGEAFRYYVNGQLRVTHPRTADQPGEWKFERLMLGSQLDGSQPFVGRIDGLRISRTARYSGETFVPGPLSKDADAWGVWDFQRETGRVLRDLSTQAHPGKIIGASWIYSDGTPFAPLPSRGLHFDGVDDYVDIPVPDGVEWPITVEMFVREHANPGDKRSEMFVLDAGIGPGRRTMRVNTGHNAQVRWEILQDDPSSVTRLRNQVAPLDSGVHHLAIVYDLNELRLYIDGVRTTPEEIPFQSRARVTSPPFFLLGGKPRNATSDFAFWKGRFHGLQVRRGAVYTTDFAVPRQLTADAETIVLYRFDEGVGDVLKDHSGNGRDGKIIGPTWLPASTFEDRAVEFDGVASCIELPEIEFDPAAIYTAEAWVQPQDCGQGSIFSLEGRSNVTLLRTANTGGFSAWSTYEDQIAYPYAGIAESGRWYHACVTWGAGTCRIAINGQQAVTDKMFPATPAQDSTLLPLLGASHDLATGGLWRQFAGRIDDFRITAGDRYGEKPFNPPTRVLPDTRTLVCYDFNSPGDEGIAVDRSGRGRDGRLVGAKKVAIESASKMFGPPSPLPTCPSPTGQALNLSSRSSVSIPPLQIDLSQPLTIEAFLRPKSEDSSGRFLTFGESKFELQRSQRFHVQLSGQTAAGVGRIAFTYSPHRPAPGEWSHVAAVWDGALLRCFQNGRLVVYQTTRTPPVPHAIVGMVIGSPSPDDKRNVDLDELRFSRVARYTEDFVPAARHEPDADTIALYHFDEGQGSVVEDASGRGHQGAVTDCTWTPSGP
jgi:serine/threonine protein kinase